MKSQSIRKKLVYKLSLTIIATIITTSFASFFYAKYEINKLFDANLVKSSKLILGLIKHEITEEQDPYFIIDPKEIGSAAKSHQYEYNLHSQAWNKDVLIYNSDESFLINKPLQDGFFDMEINNKNWRIFSFSNDGIKIVVLERYEIRQRLILEILSSIILPFFICIILIIFIIFKIINSCLKPFGVMADKIEKMSSLNPGIIEEENILSEIKPFVNSFNNLIERLKNSLESEKRFSDYAAHELKTPIAYIKTQAQLIVKNKNKNKEIEYLKDLINGVNRASNMIDKLLTLARLEPEKDFFKKEKINLSDLTKGVIKNYEKEFTKKNIKLKTNFDVNYSILANKTYIQILVNNLIDNALKYTQENGVIDIAIKRRYLIIKNSGNLIDKKDEELIFNNFFRAHNRKHIVGSGLGLSICKKIAELHNAKISYSQEDDYNVLTIDFKEI